MTKEEFNNLKEGDYVYYHSNEWTFKESGFGRVHGFFHGFVEMYYENRPGWYVIGGYESFEVIIEAISEPECNHEFITLLTSSVCSKCGVDKPSVEVTT